MVTYTCPRCGYQSSLLGHYKYHLNKKKMCEGSASLVEEYKKYDIDPFERLTSCFNEIQKVKEKQIVNIDNSTHINNNIHNNTTNNNNITVNIVPYDDTRTITMETINEIIGEIVEYNRKLLTDDESTDAEYMVAFMTKAIENKIEKDKNIEFDKKGRKNYVVFKTENGKKKIAIDDGVAKLCNDIEEDYINNIEVQKFRPNALDDEKIAEGKRTKYLIDKEIRRPPEKREEYHKGVVEHFKT